MFGENVTIGQAGIVCLFSIVTVFIVLLVISYLIDLTALLLRRSEARKDAGGSPAGYGLAAGMAAGARGRARSAPGTDAVAASGAPQGADTAAAAGSSEGSGGAPDSLRLAVIAAAVAAIYAGSTVTPVIRKITTQSSGESLWKSSGRTSVRQI